MKHVVLDTNVVVSALMTPNGKPANILRLVLSGEIQACYSDDMLAEYEDVLSRPFLKINVDESERVLSSLQEKGHHLSPPTSTIPLPDETDRTFYDTAKASEAVLITGNLKHYPTEPHIMTPADFLSGQ